MQRRSLAACAIVGGLLWLLTPLVPATFRLPVHRQYFLLLASLLFAAGVIGFYRAYGRTYSFRGRAGMFLLALGVLCFVPFLAHPVLVTYTLATGTLAYFLALFGGVLAEVGTIAIALDAWRTETPSKWLAVWFPLALPLTAVTTLGSGIVGLYGYVGLYGFAWIALGLRLWRPADSAAPAPKSVA